MDVKKMTEGSEFYANLPDEAYTSIRAVNRVIVEPLIVQKNTPEERVS